MAGAGTRLLTLGSSTGACTLGGFGCSKQRERCGRQPGKGNHCLVVLANSYRTMSPWVLTYGSLSTKCV